MLRRKIEFIPSKQFDSAYDEELPPSPLPLTSDLGDPGNEHRGANQLFDGALDPYVAQLFETRLLTAKEEQNLFCRMNYLKYRAARQRARLAQDSVVSLPQIVEIEKLLDEAEQIKSWIIRCNLRLVVSIAKRFVDSANSFDELVSDGNLSLIRAVEKFDVDLGNRFSTYATYAIRRNFYRTVLKKRQQRSRFISDEETLQAAVDNPPTSSLDEAQLVHLSRALADLLSHLDQRERVVIRARFGFDEENSKTFKQLGNELGVCKERVRQIEARAIQKLRELARHHPLHSQVDDWESLRSG